MQDQPCDPAAKASHSQPRATLPSASSAIVGWGHGAEIPLLIRWREPGSIPALSHTFGLQVHVLPTQNNGQKGSACGIPTCWRRMVAAQTQAPCPSCQPNKAKELPRSRKMHPFISQSNILPAPISLQTPATSVGRGGAIACRSKTAVGMNGAGRAHRAGMAGCSFGIRSRCSSLPSSVLGRRCTKQQSRPWRCPQNHRPMPCPPPTGISTCHDPLQFHACSHVHQQSSAQRTERDGAQCTNTSAGGEARERPPNPPRRTKLLHLCRHRITDEQR